MAALIKVVILNEKLEVVDYHASFKSMSQLGKYLGYASHVLVASSIRKANFVIPGIKDKKGYTAIISSIDDNAVMFDQQLKKIIRAKRSIRLSQQIEKHKRRQKYREEFRSKLRKLGGKSFSELEGDPLYEDFKSLVRKGVS